MLGVLTNSDLYGWAALVAASGSSIALIISTVHIGKKVKMINHAVNGVGAGMPTIQENISRMTSPPTIPNGSGLVQLVPMLLAQMDVLSRQIGSQSGESGEST